ncbi:MAG: O-methyltransferase [Clostridiales bacterium]|jgi:caffeoyl-CoA O-methyltransferase|nr:O-methyltransferase [Clostridiales bacterium]
MATAEHDYIIGLLKQETGILGRMRKYAEENSVPVVRADVAHLLSILVKNFLPGRILEAGAAIGYSAILMALAIEPVQKAHIDTVELNMEMVIMSRRNIEQANLKNVTVRVIAGDCGEVFTCLENGYDMIFLDAAKGHYIELYDDIKRLLNPGGLLVCDNVLFKGNTCKDPQQIKRKNRTIVINMRNFLDRITKDPDFETTILEAGDGVSVSVRNNA